MTSSVSLHLPSGPSKGGFETATLGFRILGCLTISPWTDAARPAAESCLFHTPKPLERLFFDALEAAFSAWPQDVRMNDSWDLRFDLSICPQTLHSCDE